MSNPKEVKVRVSREELKKATGLSWYSWHDCPDYITFTGELEEENEHGIKCLEEGHDHGKPAPQKKCGCLKSVELTTKTHNEKHVSQETLGWENSFVEQFGYLMQKGRPVTGEVITFIRRIREEALAEGRTCCLWDMGNDGNKYHKPNCPLVAATVT